MDPRHVGEMIEVLESGKPLVGYSPGLAQMEPVYREMVKQYDRTHNRWKLR
ncbi:hypothetical protein K8Q93_00305 [Candidatus Parcubacteria bacterium]|nr:hypothetical protein [Candidatus Parcubacteria bacterium]